MQIETALASMKANMQRSILAYEDQRRQLEEFGDARAQTLGASGISTDLKIGYALGLETARVMLAMNAQIKLQGIDPAGIL